MIKKIAAVSALFLMSASFTAFPLTAYASMYISPYTRVYTYETNEELLEDMLAYLENNYFDMNEIENNPDDFNLNFTYSITYQELVNYIDSYEIDYSDTLKELGDVASEFYDYFYDDVLDSENLVSEISDDDEYIWYYTDNPDELYYWTYDEESDSYIMSDSDGNIVKSYKKIHFDSDSDESSDAEETADTSEDDDDGTGSYENSSGTTDSTEDTETTEVTTTPSYSSDESSEESSEESEEEDGLATWQIVALSCVGVLIVAGAVAVVILKGKKTTK